jgi:DNA-binding response OmpR family regulator
VRRLLIVDDDEAIRKLFRLNLSGDYEIIDTSDPEQAVALAMEHQPDAILLDTRMPKFTGLDLCRTFNHYSQTNLVPILVISGALPEQAKEARTALGATGFFSKPIDFDALKSQLNTVKRRAMVPRSEVRIRLRVPLTLRGTDSGGRDFDDRKRELERILLRMHKPAFERCDRRGLYGAKREAPGRPRSLRARRCPGGGAFAVRVSLHRKDGKLDFEISARRPAGRRAMARQRGSRF